MPFILYRSSAGSGKTYTLVREYLRLALTSPMQFRHILAITFTNKAADEMRQRITGTLARLSEGGEECMKGMGAELTLLLGIDGKELASRSGKVLREILHGYEEFSVGTIDSFMHRIIRIFARDIHLPLRFEVEMDRDELLARAIDLLISRVGPDSVVTDILVNFIEHKFRESGNWRIEKDITEVARELFMESGQKEISRMSRTSPSDILAAADKIIAWNSHLRRTVSEAASVAIHAIKASGIQMDSFYRGNAGIAKYFEYIAQGNLSKWKPNSYVITTVEENKWFSSKCPASEKEAIEGIRDVLLGAFHEIQEKGSRKIPKYLFYEMVIKNIYPFSLLVEVEKHLEEIKSSRQVIHISEFNRRIAAIAMNEPAPFIYERLGQKYRHFLLDEFQDTSVLQWQNLLPLVENSLSEGHTTLVVGDGKQAIYRWRNGEVEQFVRLPEIYNAEGHPWMQQRESILRATFEPRELKMNYRSGPGIIEFNNGFFTFVAGSSDSRLRSIYQGLVQEYPGGNENGRVQIEFLDDSGPTSDYEQKSLKRVMELVEKHTGMGYRLRDIAVLCRKNEEASLMARYLLQQGYPVVSAESLHLDASREVNFLMACLKYMVDPDDMTAVAHILNFLSVTGRIPGDLHNLIAEYVHYTEPGTNGARDLFNYLTALGLPVCRNTIEGQSHFEILSALIRTFDIAGYTDPYLVALLDSIRDLHFKPMHSLMDLLGWWERNKSSISVSFPEGTNAIRAMTIHKAKGLEFPVVIFPFADLQPEIGKNKKWIPVDDSLMPGIHSMLVSPGKSLLETEYAIHHEEEWSKLQLDTVNLLYVAFTRASESLSILTGISGIASEFSAASFLSGWLKSTGAWSEGKAFYEFGSLIQKTREPDGAKVMEYLPDRWVFGDWRAGMEIRRDAEEWSDQDDHARRWGMQVHEIMAEVATESDLSRVLCQTFAEGHFSREDFSRLQVQLQKIIEDPRLSRYFRPGLRIAREAEILLPGGETYRPDRVVWLEDEVVIIDFKTGRRSPIHASQLNKYEEILEKMGERNIRKLVVYINESNPVVEL